MLKRTVIQAWVIGASLMGCSTTYIRLNDDVGRDADQDASSDAWTPSDAFTPNDTPRDAFLLPDATRDAFTPDDAPLDAFRIPDAGTDAFSPDAFVIPPESCNGADDDFDTAVDETAEFSCRMAPHAEAATCEAGRCQCRPAGTPLAPGMYVDCNSDFADGCEVPIGTDANCGGCGVACDPASQCLFEAGVGFSCEPADIEDFTLAREDGVIACILRRDGPMRRVVCRGPNSSWALSDTVPDGVMLGWTFVDLPAYEGTTVRAWRYIRADGRDVMTVCVGGVGGVYCRGDDSRGLVQRGGASAGGYNLIAREAYDFSIWNGNGVARFYDAGVRNAIVIWGGPEARGEMRYIDLHPLTYTAGLVIADQVILWIPESSRPSPHPPGLYSWGPVRGFLGGSGWVDVPGPTLPIVPVRDIEWPGCARDVCCARRFPEGTVVCWGHRPSAPDEFTALPIIGIVGPTAVPMPNGHVVVCGSGFAGEHLCVDATAAIEGETVTPVTRPLWDYRNHWQAMCIRRRLNWWQCWGTHEGWGHE